MQLSENFLYELFKLAFQKKEILEVMTAHLKYHYLPNDSLKKIFKYISAYLKELKKIPSLGMVTEYHSADRNHLDILITIQKIKEAELVSSEMILKPFEEYVKRVRFQELHEKTAELYNEGRREEAMKLMATDSQEIVEFSILSDSTYFEPVFSNFEERHEERIRTEENSILANKMPFGIDYLDQITFGGMDVGETALFILRSGVGKSTWLKHHGLIAARLGYNTLHVQLEGSKREALDKYDQAWTGLLYNDLKIGNIPEELYAKLIATANRLATSKKDIYVQAYEQFGMVTMLDIRNLLIEFEKVNGKCDLLILDYIKHLHPGDGIKYGVDTQSEKKRKENTAEAIKNLAVEFKTRIMTADQAHDVPISIWNDPNQVLTRHNIANAKNLPDSFSFVFTGNQTKDEKENGTMRIHIDKLRYYKEMGKTFKIATNYDRGRFYEKQRTINEFL